MAREFDDLGCWLPSEFLTDDDLVTNFEPRRLKTRGLDGFFYGFGNSFSFNTDLSSPSEMVTSSTEDGSENDFLVAELTRKLAQSTLRNYNFFSHNASNVWKLTGSPQSTLYGCKVGLSGCPNSVSKVCSPPDPEEYLRRDWLCAAERVRMIEETAAFYSSNVFPPHVKPSTSPSAGFHPIQARSQIRISSQLLQAAMVKQRQQGMMKKGVYGPKLMEFQFHNEKRNCGLGKIRDSRMRPCPGLQQPSSGTQAVYLSEPEPKKERMGTGVFLPLRFGAIPADNHKKSVCATVPLQEKVVHAMKLDVKSVDSHLQRKIDSEASNFDFDAAAVLKHTNNVLTAAEQRRTLSAQPAMNQQLRLPQEWTY